MALAATNSGLQRALGDTRGLMRAVGPAVSLSVPRAQLLLAQWQVPLFASRLVDVDATCLDPAVLAAWLLKHADQPIARLHACVGGVMVPAKHLLNTAVLHLACDKVGLGFGLPMLWGCALLYEACAELSLPQDDVLVPAALLLADLLRARSTAQCSSFGSLGLEIHAACCLAAVASAKAYFTSVTGVAAQFDSILAECTWAPAHCRSHGVVATWRQLCSGGIAMLNPVPLGMVPRISACQRSKRVTHRAGVQPLAPLLAHEVRPALLLAAADLGSTGTGPRPASDSTSRAVTASPPSIVPVLGRGSYVGLDEQPPVQHAALDRIVLGQPALPTSQPAPPLLQLARQPSVGAPTRGRAMPPRPVFSTLRQARQPGGGAPLTELHRTPQSTDSPPSSTRSASTEEINAAPRTVQDALVQTVLLASSARGCSQDQMAQLLPKLAAKPSTTLPSDRDHLAWEHEGGLFAAKTADLTTYFREVMLRQLRVVESSVV